MALDRGGSPVGSHDPLRHLHGGASPFEIMEAASPIQIGMTIELGTSYPVNIVLIRDGVKHAMHRPVLAAAAAR